MAWVFDANGYELDPGVADEISDLLRKSNPKLRILTLRVPATEAQLERYENVSDVLMELKRELAGRAAQ